jgi:hypothetical protein
MRIEINKKWLEQNYKQFSNAYDNQQYIEEKGTSLLIDTEIENNELLISDNDKITISGGNDNIYFYYEEKPTINELLNLATIISKYYNKAKSAIESLK